MVTSTLALPWPSFKARPVRPSAFQAIHAYTMNFQAALFLAIATLYVAGAHAQGMFKCVQDGKTVYQAQPCPEAAKQDSLKVQVAPPAPTGADVDKTIEFMSTYRACAEGSQFWRQEVSELYEGWRGRNSAMVSRIENDKALRARYEQRTAAKRSGKASMCRPVALELRGVKQ